MTSLTDTHHGDRDAGGARPNPDAETRRDAGAGRWERGPGTHGGAKAHEARETHAETAKPRRRKAKTGGNQGATMKETPSAADVAAGDRFDEIVARGGIVVEVFVRAAGPNQWFPVGPLAVLSAKAIKREIWAAEEPLRKAAFKMYPALAKPPAFGRVEYGYRERDEEKKISEVDIRDAAGKKNPFDDVILLTREDDSTESESEGFFSKIKKALNPYDG